MIGKTIGAILGTVAFALLFGVPKKYFPYCGLIGGAGWIAYELLVEAGLSPVEATVVAVMLVAFSSRYCAVFCECPVTVFLISGIFPLVPGAGIYRTAYYLVRNEKHLALQSGYRAVCTVVAIVIGIVIVHELPNRFFAVIKSRKK